MIRRAESDAVKRLEAYLAEDVEIDFAGTALPDDEFHEEPHFEEANVLEEKPSAVRLAVIRIHKNLRHPSKELLCRALRIGGTNKVALRAASEMKSDVCSESKSPKSHSDTYTEFNQGVGVVLFMPTHEQVLEFLNMVDLATRFTIAFQCHLKGPMIACLCL